MKKIIPILGLLLVVFGSCKKDKGSPTGDVQVKEGLLVYLKFDGNIADSSGNNNPTTSIGTPLGFDEHGNANSAFNGTGGAERVLVTNNGSIVFDDQFTVSLNFMYRDTIPEVLASIIHKSTGFGPSFIMGSSDINSHLFNFAVNVTADCNGTETLSQDGDFLTGLTPEPESWYNAICVYQKGTVTVYINGSLISQVTTPASKPLLCPDAQIVIGGYWDGNPFALNGKVDEFRLYNRALNQDEIYTLSANFQ